MGEVGISIWIEYTWWCMLLVCDARNITAFEQLSGTQVIVPQPQEYNSIHGTYPDQATDRPASTKWRRVAAYPSYVGSFKIVQNKD